MSSKRAKVREMKRRKQQQRKLTIAAACGLVVLIGVAIALAVLNNYSESYVMTFDGEKVDTADMRFCSLFVSGEDEAAAKEQALDLVLQMKVFEKKAAESGIALTEEESAANQTEAANLKRSFESGGYDLSFISDERVAEIMGYMGPIQEKLLEQNTGDFQVDENDYMTALDDYKLNNKVAYYDMDVKYIVNPDQAILDSAWTQLEAGADFDTMIAENSSIYNEETGVEILPLREQMFPAEVNDAVVALSAGEYTSVMDIGGMFAIIYVDNVEIPSEDEIAATFREQYELQKKDEMFEGVVNSWKEEAKPIYTVNQKGYDAA